MSSVCEPVPLCNASVSASDSRCTKTVSAGGAIDCVHRQSNIVSNRLPVRSSGVQLKQRGPSEGLSVTGKGWSVVFFEKNQRPKSDSSLTLGVRVTIVRSN